MLTQQQILDRLEYRDGNLITRTKSNRWPIGRIIGSPDKEGYICASIAGKTYKVHRLVFLMHHGFLPMILDHIDGNPANNRVENLREGSHSQNCGNQRAKNTNKSGYKGVCWDRASQTWMVQLMVKGKHVYKAKFTDKLEAAKAYDKMAEEYFGEFARLNFPSQLLEALQGVKV